MSHNECYSNYSKRNGRQSFRGARTGLRGGRYAQYTPQEKLDARTIKGPGCWEIQGAKCGPNGYGQVFLGRVHGKLIRKAAHRLAWELSHGPIPDGLTVLHKCDNPRCVRPEHLMLGTQRDNVHDAIRKGRRNAFGHQKLTAQDVVQIRVRAAHGDDFSDLATEFNLTRHSIAGIVRGDTWKHLPVLERVPHVHLQVRGEVA